MQQEYASPSGTFKLKDFHYKYGKELTLFEKQTPR